MNVFQRARESAVSGESSLRPRVRGSLAVMLERYCAEHRRCREAPSVATAVRKLRRNLGVRGPSARRTWPSFKPNVPPVSITGASQSRSAVNGCSRTRGTRATPMFEPGHPRHAADIQSLLHGEPTTLRSTISHCTPSIFVFPRVTASQPLCIARLRAEGGGRRLRAWRSFYFVCHQAARRPCFPALPLHVGSPRDRLRALSLPGVARWPASWESVSDAASRSGRGTW
jgi:hypothetical protein